MKTIKSIWELIKPVFKRYWGVIILIIIFLSMILGWIIGNEWLKVFGVLFFILWLCVLAMVYILKSLVDPEPLPLADFREVENVEKYDNALLWELYHKETGRCVSSTVYVLMLPDEKHYMDWLELQATKFLMLKETKLPPKPKFDIDYPDETDKINMEDL